MKYLIITIITGLLIVNGLKAIKTNYVDQVNERIVLINNEVK